VRFTDGINFTFPNETVLGAGQYFVLARNPAQFAVRFPGVTPNGVYSGKLENNGEPLTLSGPLGQVIFSVAYDNAAPWPAEADNSALSLQRMNFTTAVTNAAGWLAAPPTPGGPPEPGLVDADGDNLPDQWEEMHGVTDPNADDDGDGLTNYQEYLAGTEPRDEDDRLRLEILRPDSVPGGLAVVVGFNARSNRTYSVLYRESNSPTNTAWQSLARFSSVPTNRLITVTNLIRPDAPTRFYQLATPRLP